jgi:FkbM family methyltransferase
MSDKPTGSRYRRRTMLEVVAQALPRGGPFGAVRRALKRSYERLLAWQASGLESVLPGGEVVRVAPAYRHITWNTDEYEAFRAAVRPGQVVIDAGANVGAYSVLFGHWVGAAGRVYAFEPDPAAFDGLVRHISINGLDGRVRPIRAAIAERSSSATRLAVAASGTSRLVDATGSVGQDTIDVAAVSIDEFCRDEGVRPDVIKIDVEGAELAALRGARRTIAETPGLALFVEMHPSLWRASGMTAAGMKGQCEALGLAAERLDGSRDALWTTEGVCLRLRPGHP